MPSVSTSWVLARPGTPTSSPWPPASKVDQRLLDHRVLAEDDAPHFIPEHREPHRQRFRFGDNRLRVAGGRRSGGREGHGDPVRNAMR